MPQGRDDARADGDIGHEAAVHDVHVHPVRTGLPTGGVGSCFLGLGLVYGFMSARRFFVWGASGGQRQPAYTVNSEVVTDCPPSFIIQLRLEHLTERP